MKTLAEKLFSGSHAKCEMESQLYDAGVQFDEIGWDYYDCSLEIYGVPADCRLTAAVQKIIYDSGFARVFVNHQDKWETHYTFPREGGFAEVKGWRVSYPHKRDDERGGIWVEEHVPTWPQKWFDTGYVLIKSLVKG